MFFTKDKRRIWKQIGCIEEELDNLREDIGDVDFDWKEFRDVVYDYFSKFDERIEKIENELKELKEDKTREIDDEEHSRKAKILNDIKAVQEYSLEDVLNYYMKG